MTIEQLSTGPTEGTGRAATHEVLNQAPPRVDVDEYALNPALGEGVIVFAPDVDVDRLHRIGRHVGTEHYQRDAQLVDVHPPVHHGHDRWGNRVDEIEFHPSYHRIMEYSVARGLHTGAWARPGP